MQRYVMVSGVFFSLLAIVQLVRFLMRWPVSIAGVPIPTWASLIAALIVGSLAVWAFRVGSAKAAQV